jgi:hypothetical protein
MVVFAAILAFVTIMHVLVEGVDKPFAQHLLEIWQSFGLLFICLLCLIPVFAYDAVKLSHRFAGPMVSLRRTLEQLADGKVVEPLRFRKDDYWHGLSDATNRIAQRLRQVEANSRSTEEKPSELTVS